jgi:phosphoglycolate phosphatase-like HAD superfamily hydrolase
MIGDSATDVLAGRLAGVPVIGYASKPGKVQALMDAQTEAVVADLSQITSALLAASHG